MNMYPFTAVTNIRSHLAYKFHSLRASAQRELFLGKLIGRDTLLQTFPRGMERKNPNRKLLPIQDIPIEKIVGSVNRHDDFDYKFRPLKENARDRWIDIHLFLEEGWPPILVHKIGSEYFVEDGHHRLSVAQELGMHQRTVMLLDVIGPLSRNDLVGSRIQKFRHCRHEGFKIQMMHGMDDRLQGRPQTLSDPFPVLFDPPLHGGECNMIGNFVDRLHA